MEAYCVFYVNSRTYGFWNLQIFLSPPLKVVFTMPETKAGICYNCSIPERHNSKRSIPITSLILFTLDGKITYPHEL